MDRRESLKSLLLGSLAGGMLVTGCSPESPEADVEEVVKDADEKHYGRTTKEESRDELLQSGEFFTGHEIETIAVLCDLILPPNDEYGGATDAGVPGFIEFMVKDIPLHQLPLRGGLMWLDNFANSEYLVEFKACQVPQQKAILDTIAYPDPEIPLNEQPQGIRFFALMKDLTLTGYYTSEMGLKDLGYKGNIPNVWDGVPEEVLKDHEVSYDKVWLAKCIDQEKRMDIAKWDDEGNLLS
ncbi:MAG: gluconate 2-dehydrogenase subunit 3 family protein [Cyclobacteriaceae bacterium]